MNGISPDTLPVSKEAYEAVLRVNRFLTEHRSPVPHHFTINPIPTTGMGSKEAASVRVVQGYKGISFFRELTTVFLALDNGKNILVCYDAMNSYDPEKIERLYRAKILPQERNKSIYGIVNPFTLRYDDRIIDGIFMDQSILDGRLMCTNAGTPEITIEFSPLEYYNKLQHLRLIHTGDFISDRVRFEHPRHGNIVVLAGPPGLTAGVMENRIESEFLRLLRLATQEKEAHQAITTDERAASLLQNIRPTVTTRTLGGADAIWDQQFIEKLLPGIRTGGFEIPSDVRTSFIEAAQTFYRQIRNAPGGKVIILGDNYNSQDAWRIRKHCLGDNEFSHVHFLFLPEVVRNHVAANPEQAKNIALLAPSFVTEAYASFLSRFPHTRLLSPEQDRKLQLIRDKLSLTDGRPNSDKAIIAEIQPVYNSLTSDITGQFPSDEPITLVQALTHLGPMRANLPNNVASRLNMVRPLDLAAKVGAEICWAEAFPAPHWYPHIEDDLPRAVERSNNLAGACMSATKFDSLLAAHGLGE